MELEKRSKDRLDAEKIKANEIQLLREKAMGREFRRAREALEERLRLQQAGVREKYGELVTSTTVSTKTYSGKPINKSIHHVICDLNSTINHIVLFVI